MLRFYFFRSVPSISRTVVIFVSGRHYLPVQTEVADLVGIPAPSVEEADDLDLENCVLKFKDLQMVKVDIQHDLDFRPNSSGDLETRHYRTGLVTQRGSIKSNDWPFVSYNGYSGPGFVGAEETD